MIVWQVDIQLFDLFFLKNGKIVILLCDFIATLYLTKLAVAEAVAILFGVSFHTLTFSASEKSTLI